MSKWKPRAATLIDVIGTLQEQLALNNADRAGLLEDIDTLEGKVADLQDRLSQEVARLGAPNSKIRAWAADLVQAYIQGFDAEKSSLPDLLSEIQEILHKREMKIVDDNLLLAKAARELDLNTAELERLRSENSDLRVQLGHPLKGEENRG